MSVEGYHMGPSPNWYLSRVTDCNNEGIFAYGAQNNFVLIDVSKTPPIYKSFNAAHDNKLTCLNFSTKNPSYLATGGKDRQIIVWDINKPGVSLHRANCLHGIVCLEWQQDSDSTIYLIDESGSGILVWNIHNNGPRFHKLPIRSIACALASWALNNRYVAVGYKSGLIAIVSMIRGAEVSYKLRGHEDEILSLSWNSTYSNSDNRKNWSDTQDLLSSSRDRTLRCWNIEREKCTHCTKMPPMKKHFNPNDDKRAKQWIVAKWRPGFVNHAICAGISSDLMMVDVHSMRKAHWEMFVTKENGGHDRCIYSISTFKDKIAVTISQDRQIVVWDIPQMKSTFCLPTLGGFAYSLSFSPVDIGRLAVGAGDNTIKIWNTISSTSPYAFQNFWQNIKGKVTALAWHPDNESWLGFGTEEGRVGVLDVVSNKPAIISSTHHRNQVYSLSWGPFKGEDAKLFSCGDEVIRIHDFRKPSSEALDLGVFLGTTATTNGTSPTDPPAEGKDSKYGFTEVRWKSDWKTIAIGHKDGLVHIYSNSWVLLAKLLGQSHLVQCIQWHPLCTTLSPNCSPMQNWIAVSTYGADIQLYDLSDIISSSSSNAPPPAQPKLLLTSTQTLRGHHSRVTSIAWSPHLDGRLASTSFDGTTQVWDVISRQPLANYRGQLGNGFSVAWSPHDPDKLFSGSDDSTVHQFCVSKLKDTIPPPLKMKSSKAKKSKDKEEHPKKDSDRENWRETSEPLESQEGGAPHDEPKIDYKEQSPDSTKSGAKTAETRSVKRKVQYRSLFPASNTLENRNKAAILQDIHTLTDQFNTNRIVKEEEVKDQTHLAFFSRDGHQEIIETVKREVEHHVKNGNLDCAIQLDIWTGDMERIQGFAEKQALTDFIVSAANLVSRSFWLEMCEKYAEQLVLEGNYTKASCYFLSCHKVYQAIEMLKEQNMFKEAISIARMRLPASDPVISNLMKAWVEKALKDGDFEKAAKCFLSLGDNASAAKVLARRTDASNLRAAAYVAASDGLAVESALHAAQCVRAALLSNDYELVKQLVQDQQGINVLKGTESLLSLSTAHQFLKKSISEAAKINQNGILKSFFVDLKSGDFELWRGMTPIFLREAREKFQELEVPSQKLLTEMFPNRIVPCHANEIVLQTSLDIALSSFESADSDASWELLNKVLLENFNASNINCSIKELYLLIFHAVVVWRSAQNCSPVIDLSNCSQSNYRCLYSLKDSQKLTAEITPPLQQSFAAIFFANLLDVLLQEIPNLPRKIFSHCAQQEQLKKIEEKILAEISLAEENEKSPGRGEKTEMEIVEKPVTISPDEALEKAKEQCFQLLKEKLISMGMQCNDDDAKDPPSSETQGANNVKLIKEELVSTRVNDILDTVDYPEMPDQNLSDIMARNIETVENPTDEIENNVKDEIVSQSLEEDLLKFNPKLANEEDSNTTINEIQLKTNEDFANEEDSITTVKEIPLKINDDFANESDSNTTIKEIPLKINEDIANEADSITTIKTETSAEIDTLKSSPTNFKQDEQSKGEPAEDKTKKFGLFEGLKNFDSRMNKESVALRLFKSPARAASGDSNFETRKKSSEPSSTDTSKVFVKLPFSDDDQTSRHVLLPDESNEESQLVTEKMENLVAEAVFEETDSEQFAECSEEMDEESKFGVLHHPKIITAVPDVEKDDSSVTVKEENVVAEDGYEESDTKQFAELINVDEETVSQNSKIVTEVPDVEKENALNKPDDQMILDGVSQIDNSVEPKERPIMSETEMFEREENETNVTINSQQEDLCELGQNRDEANSEDRSTGTEVRISDDAEPKNLIDFDNINQREDEMNNPPNRDPTIGNAEVETRPPNEPENATSEQSPPDDSCPGCYEVTESFSSFMLIICKSFTVTEFVRRQKVANEVKLLEIEIANASVQLKEDDAKDESNVVDEMHARRLLLIEQLRDLNKATNDVPFPNVHVLSEKLLQLLCLLLPRICCPKAKQQLSKLYSTLQSQFE